ncbi:hypothetical protein ACF2JD_02755 [Aeromonas sp. A-5]|uniref:hypothetical protein n=1 Tax=Aeromonas ichthyocola TaxID=3367746 RepID=UPI0038F52229
MSPPTARTRPDSNVRRGLIDLMKDAGFTDEELAKLNEAKNNSDALVNTEVAAFKLVQQSDGDPAANQQKAIAMMHDKAYHQNKGRIMSPIDDFYVMMEAPQPRGGRERQPIPPCCAISSSPSAWC